MASRWLPIILALEIESAGWQANVPLEIRKLVREMSIANPLWGAPRIHGELLKLGIEIGQATVAKYCAKTRCAFPDLAHLPAEPRPRHRGHRHVRRGVRLVSAALRYGHPRPRAPENHSHGRHRTSHCGL